MGLGLQWDWGCNRVRAAMGLGLQVGRRAGLGGGQLALHVVSGGGETALGGVAQVGAME